MSIKQQMIRSHKQWLQYLETQDYEYWSMLGLVADNIVKQIERRAHNGFLGAGSLTYMNKYIDKEIRDLRNQINSLLKRGMSTGYDYGVKTQIESLLGNIPDKYKLGIGSSYINKAGVVVRWDGSIELYRDSKWFEMNSKALENLYKMGSMTGEPLSARVWDLTRSTQKALKQAIATNIFQEQNATVLARSVRGFLNEPDRLFRRVRKDGKLVLSKPAQAYHPGTGTYRSSYKNALRLARTEMSEAYTNGAMDYIRSKEWIDGWTWRVSSGNPCPECASLDGQYFSKDIAFALAHPQCYCYPEPHIKVA